MIVDKSVDDLVEEKSSAVSSQRRAALVAGFGLLLMIVPAVFANFVVLENLVVPGDAAATAANAAANETQLLFAILALGLVVVLDIIVSWALYVFFKPVNRNLSMMMALFRIVYTAIFAVAILNLVQALRLLNGAGGLGTEQLQNQVYSSLEAFNAQWGFGLIFFGIHLVLLGILTYQSSIVSKILGILVIIAGLGYLVDSIAGVLAPDLNIAIGQFTFIGELLLALWLVVQGLNANAWKDRTLESVS